MTRLTEETFQAWVKEGMEMAKQFLEVKGELPNILCGFNEHSMTLLSDLPREVWPAAARLMAEKSEALCNIAEAWVAEVSNEEWRKDKRPAGERDNRKERIIAQAKMRNGVKYTIWQEFEHDWNGKIKWVGGVVEMATDVKEEKSYLLDGVY